MAVNLTQTMETKNPELKDLNTLAPKYDITYDRAAIEKILNQGTDASYVVKDKELQAGENQFAQNVAVGQDNLIEAMRKGYNSQIATGMTRGMQAANELATSLGVQDKNSAGALELANKRAMLGDELQADYAKNSLQAYQNSEAAKQAMATLASQLYQADMLGYTGELSYNAGIDANNATRDAATLGLEGAKYGADKNYAGIVYGADKNLEGTKYSADINFESNKYVADTNLTSTKISAAATKAAAATAAAATIKAAGISASASQLDAFQNHLQTNLNNGGSTEDLALRLYNDTATNTKFNNYNDALYMAKVMRNEATNTINKTKSTSTTTTTSNKAVKKQTNPYTSEIVY